MVSGADRGPIRSDEFDVFLCHNSADKAEVQRVADQLRELGLKPWLDREQLRPGLPAAGGLQAQLGSVKAAAVFVGASGIGPWQGMEVLAFLSELVERGCPVIPVLLPSCPAKPPLPPFLKMLTWVDMREEGAVSKLHWGITGTKLDPAVGGPMTPVTTENLEDCTISELVRRGHYDVALRRIRMRMLAGGHRELRNMVAEVEWILQRNLDFATYADAMELKSLIESALRPQPPLFSQAAPHATGPPASAPRVKNARLALALLAIAVIAVLAYFLVTRFLLR